MPRRLGQPISSPKSPSELHLEWHLPHRQQRTRQALERTSKQEQADSDLSFRAFWLHCGRLREFPLFPSFSGQREPQWPSATRTRLFLEGYFRRKLRSV